MGTVTSVDGIQLFIHALSVSMPERDYLALPDRQGLSGLPIDGQVYRDTAHPGVVFRCSAGMDWARYRYSPCGVTLFDRNP